ncbi:DUF1508 domain-containing protein [Candidatus Kaiserbacteria bacterium]|nr:DUF1508 domain-containing protein [Candidatus Kaiserbacteria bacterium]
MTTFEIYKDVAGYFRWRLVAANGEKVAASEAYVSKQGATTSAERVKYWASVAHIVALV